MLSLDTRVDPNEEEVAAQVIDGEAIMINLSTGVYYSMDKVGGVAWPLLAARHDLRDVAAAIAARYAVAASRVETDLQRLVEQLLAESLVRLSAHTTAIGAPDVLPPEAEATSVYEPPQLHIYRDMEEMLALDPPMPHLSDIPWKDQEDE
jgi:Coenzyme PQQ synthesis protein D (PqqD)